MWHVPRNWVQCAATMYLLYGVFFSVHEKLNNQSISQSINQSKMRKRLWFFVSHTQWQAKPFRLLYMHKRTRLTIHTILCEFVSKSYSPSFQKILPSIRHLPFLRTTKSNFQAHLKGRHNPLEEKIEWIRNCPAGLSHTDTILTRDSTYQVVNTSQIYRLPLCKPYFLVINCFENTTKVRTITKSIPFCVGWTDTKFLDMILSS
jgi:hypothetical protein